MKYAIALSLIPVLLGSCSPMMYRLCPSHSGKSMTLSGTVLAVEDDGDFLLETYGRLAFIDVGDTGIEVEMGDQVRVTGTVEHDEKESEAPELDATGISPMNG